VRRLLLTAGLLGAIGMTATALAEPSLQQQVDPVEPLPPLPTPGPQQHVLKLGDTMRVEGASIGCQVTRRSARLVIECRRAGALARTYGTFLSDRTATVARFRSSRNAQVVFSARQKGGWRACGRSPRASRAARAAAGECR
jgi:hypothetical protein